VDGLLDQHNPFWGEQSFSRLHANGEERGGVHRGRQSIRRQPANWKETGEHEHMDEAVAQFQFEEMHIVIAHVDKTCLINTAQCRHVDVNKHILYR
jgi:hypothetical protein